MKLSNQAFSIILFGLKQMLRRAARKYPSFKNHLKEKNFTAQIKVMDNSEGRYFTFSDGNIISKRGIHPSPEVSMNFSSAGLAFKLLMPPRNYLSLISAMKNFHLLLEGDDELTYWFLETISLMQSAGIEYGTDVGSGVKRYTSNTNGGPLFVYVKDGKIIRITPIEFDESDAQPWIIEARGKRFIPPRKTTVSPYTFAWKSMVYSPDRLLYPLKRVDFDPNGERNCKIGL